MAAEIVLFLGYPSAKRGGQEIAAFAFGQGLARIGYPVTAVCNRDGDLVPAYRAFCSNVVLVREPTSALRWVGGLIAGRGRRRRIIYGQSVSQIFPLWTISSLADAPLVCHLHLPPNDNISKSDRFALSRVTKFFAVSHFTATQWQERLAVPAGKIVTIHNGVDGE